MIRVIARSDFIFVRAAASSFHQQGGQLNDACVLVVSTSGWQARTFDNDNRW
jgi:hypothetical protein